MSWSIERSFPLFIVLALAGLLLSADGGSSLWPAASFLAAILALLTILRHRRGGRYSLAARLMLCALIMGASASALWLADLAARDDRVWLRHSRERLDQGAAQAVEMMTRLEREARVRATAALVPAADLDALAQPILMGSSSLGVGISIWGVDGILKWSGEVPGPERPSAGEFPQIVDHGFRRYLSVSADDGTGYVAFADVSLGITRELFPRLGVGADPGRPLSEATGILVGVLVSPPRPEDVGASLERVVAVPEEDPWVWLSLKAPSVRAERRSALRSAGRVLARLTLLALTLAGLLIWRGWSGRRIDRASAGLSLVMVLLLAAARVGVDRAGLLELAFSTDHEVARLLLEPAYFATTWGLGLMRSVLDFLLTASALALALLLLLPLWLALLERPGRWTRLLGWAVLSGATVSFLLWCAGLQEVVAQNANPKLIGLDAPFFTLPFQALHLSMLLALLAPAGFLLLGWERWLRRWGRRSPGLALLSGFVVAGALLLAGLSGPRAAWALLLPVLASLSSPAVRHPSFSIRVVAALVAVLWLAGVQTDGLREVYSQLKESVATERAQDRLHPEDNWRRVLVEELLRELADEPERVRRLADPGVDRSNAAFELWAGSVKGTGVTPCSKSVPCWARASILGVVSCG